LQTAAQNNPALQAKFKEYYAALEKVPQAGTLPDPTFAFGYFIMPVETKNGPQQAKLSASQMVPWFGTLASRENSAEAYAKAKYELFEDAKSNLFYNVKKAYFDLFFVGKAIDVTLEQIEILFSLQGLAKVKVESGSAISVDVYRVEMEINDLENQLALLRDNSVALAVKFNALLNVDASSNINVDDVLADTVLYSKSAEFDSVLTNNKTLKSFDYQLDELDSRKKTAGKEGLPQFSIGIDYTFIRDGNSVASNAGQDAFLFPRVGISVPLYRDKYKAKVQELAYLHEAKSLERSDKENALAVMFETAWTDYSDAVRRLDLYDKQTILAQKSLSLLESNYATNNAGFEEILRMQRRLLAYKLEKYKATADKAVAVAFVEYLQGK